MKKFIVVLLIFVSVVSCFAAKVSKPKTVSIDGSRILVSGNSYMYYGDMVFTHGYDPSLEDHYDDTGYLYQLAKSMGDEVSVTSYVYGSHQMWDLFGEKCTMKNKPCLGLSHLDELAQDAEYDYVIFQDCGSEFDMEYMDYLKSAKAMFKEANPTVKLVYVVNPAAYGYNGFKYGKTLTAVLNHLNEIEKMGFIIVDWGRVVAGILDGSEVIPDSTFKYDVHSFILQQSKKDGYHPNLLCTYIRTAMIYCAITGKPVAETNYEMFGDSNYNSNFLTREEFKTKYYSYVYPDGSLPETNFIEIMNSKSEMAGIQAVMQKVLNEKAYRNNNFPEMMELGAQPISYKGIEGDSTNSVD